MIDYLNALSHSPYGAIIATVLGMCALAAAVITVQDFFRNKRNKGDPNKHQCVGGPKPCACTCSQECDLTFS